MCRCTCRTLTAPTAQEHHSQETAGLDLSLVTVLRCQGHPGNAAGPRSPPQRGPAAGARIISACAPTNPGPGAPAAEGPAAPPGTETAPHRHQWDHRPPRHRARPGHRPRRETAGPPPPALTPASRPPDPAPRATTMPGIAAARPVSRYQPTGPGVPIPTQASSTPDARHTAARPQPCHDPQPPRAAAGPLRHATAACTWLACLLMLSHRRRAFFAMAPALLARPEGSLPNRRSRNVRRKRYVRRPYQPFQCAAHPPVRRGDGPDRHHWAVGRPCISSAAVVPVLIRAAMSGWRRSLSKQRRRVGPMLPTGIPSRALIWA